MESFRRWLIVSTKNSPQEEKNVRHQFSEWHCLEDTPVKNRISGSNCSPIAIVACWCAQAIEYKCRTVESHPVQWFVSNHFLWMQLQRYGELSNSAIVQTLQLASDRRSGWQTELYLNEVIKRPGALTHYLNYLWKLTVCGCWQVALFLLLRIRATHLQLIHLFHNWGKVNWKERFSLCTNWVFALSLATPLEALIINHRVLSLSTGSIFAAAWSCNNFFVFRILSYSVFLLGMALLLSLRPAGWR